MDDVATTCPVELVERMAFCNAEMVRLVVDAVLKYPVADEKRELDA